MAGDLFPSFSYVVQINRADRRRLICDNIPTITNRHVANTYRSRKSSLSLANKNTNSGCRECYAEERASTHVIHTFMFYNKLLLHISTSVTNGYDDICANNYY